MSAPRFLLIPEWQGSASSRALRLTDGADALRGDLPRAALREVAVPLEAGDALGTLVHRLGSVLRTRDAALEALAEGEGPAILLGGDCAADLAGLQHAVARVGAGRLAVLWLDAHADLQHPATSPSGAASGMVLRAALGDSLPELALPEPLRPELVALVGVRDLDQEESFQLGELGIPSVLAPADTPEAWARAVVAQLTAGGAEHLYVHLDLDVLDPAAFDAVHAPVPFGLSLEALLALLRAAVAALPLAGAAICEFAPASPADAEDALPTVLRLLAALTSAGRDA